MQPNSGRFDDNMLAAIKGSNSHNDKFFEKGSQRGKELSAAKLKALIKPREVQIDDLPSDISNDEWGEIQRYGQRLHEDAQRKVKEQHKIKA